MTSLNYLSRKHFFYVMTNFFPHGAEVVEVWLQGEYLPHYNTYT